MLSEDNYRKMLDDKLKEELEEYLESKEAEELADLLEVIYAIAKTKGMSREDLEQLRQDKANKRGGLEKRILLKEVREK